MNRKGDTKCQDISIINIRAETQDSIVGESENPSVTSVVLEGLNNEEGIIFFNKLNTICESEHISGIMPNQSILSSNLSKFESFKILTLMT